MGASTTRQGLIVLAFILVLLACFEGIRAEGESKASQDNKELVIEEPKPMESVAEDEKQKVDQIKSDTHTRAKRYGYGGYYGGGGYPYYGGYSGGYGGGYGGGYPYGGYGGGRTVIIKKIIIRPGYNSYGGGYGGYGGNYYG